MNKYQTVLDQFWLTDRLTPSVTDQLLSMHGSLLQRLFLCYDTCVHSLVGFLYGSCEHLLLVNKIMNILPDKYFKTVFWVSVLHGSLLQFLLDHGEFLNTDISQGSVATRLRCDGIFKHQFVANLPLSLAVKEFWKLVNISGNYGQKFSVLFFD